MFSYVHLLSLQEFENDISDFNQRVEDLDRRLGTVFIQAFDDAPDLEHAFKVCMGGGATHSFPSSASLSLPSQMGRSIHFQLLCSCREELLPLV